MMYSWNTESWPWSAGLFMLTRSGCWIGRVWGSWVTKLTFITRFSDTISIGLWQVPDIETLTMEDLIARVLMMTGDQSLGIASAVHSSFPVWSTIGAIAKAIQQRTARSMVHVATDAVILDTGSSSLVTGVALERHKRVLADACWL